MRFNEVKGKKPPVELGPEPELPPGVDPRVGVPKDVNGKVYRVGHQVAYPMQDRNTRLLYIEVRRVLKIENNQVYLSSRALLHPENCLIINS